MTDTITSQTESATSTEQAYQRALHLTLQIAVSHHRAGRLAEAGQLYRDILQVQSEHALANHNLGVLLLQTQQPAEGLPYLENALAANPESERYWLSYIDALEQAGHTEQAREMLAFAREHGLEGKDAQVLSGILNMGGQHAATAARAQQQLSP